MHIYNLQCMSLVLICFVLCAIPVQSALLWIQRFFRQLCVSNFVLAVWDRPTYWCDGEVSTNFGLMCMLTPLLLTSKLLFVFCLFCLVFCKDNFCVMITKMCILNFFHTHFPQNLYTEQLLACVEVLLEVCGEDCGIISLPLLKVLVTIQCVSTEPQITTKVEHTQKPYILLPLYSLLVLSKWNLQP